MNFLEQLVSEWYSYQGYFVRTNVKVGKRDAGGWEGELDVVAFHPESNAIIHIETSMDAPSWPKRRERFAQKFMIGQKYIPELFPFAQERPLQVVVFGYPRTSRQEHPLGEDIQVLMMPQLISEIAEEFSKTRVENTVVPEEFSLLRAMQFALDYGGYLQDSQEGGR